MLVVVILLIYYVTKQYYITIMIGFNFLYKLIIFYRCDYYGFWYYKSESFEFSQNRVTETTIVL